MLLVRFLRLCNRYLVHIVYIIIVFVCVYIYIYIVFWVFLGFLLLWFWFYLGSPRAGGLLVSFGFCLWFTFAVFPRLGVCLCLLVSVCVLLFVVFPRPGDCLCLFCLWSALRLCSFVFDALLVLFICFSFWFIALVGPGVCLVFIFGCFSFSCCSSVFGW